MSKEKWKLFGAFRKKEKENDIILFPDPKDVFTEPEMEMYFTPILTYNYESNEREYKIHILTSAGLICENSYLNSENRFFGFQYIDKKYKFLGNLNTFGNSQIKEVFKFLKSDFEKNKDYYLEQKVTLADYIKMIKPLAKRAGIFTEGQSLSTYLENFYSYELIKYNYKKTNKLKHLFEITEAVQKNNASYFFHENETKNMLTYFYNNLNDYFKTRYDFKNAKPICAVDTFKFTNFISLAVIFFDKEKNIVYNFEYSKN